VRNSAKGRRLAVYKNWKTPCKDREPLKLDSPCAGQINAGPRTSDVFISPSSSSPLYLFFSVPPTLLFPSFETIKARLIIIVPL